MSQHAATTEAHAPRACVPQQEKSSQQEASALQWRVALARATKPARKNRPSATTCTHKIRMWGNLTKIVKQW